MPRPLDRGRQRALVPGAGAELAAWLDLAALRDVASQARSVLVVNLADLVDAEAADLAPPAKAATAAPARSASAARTTSATWTAPATGTIAATRTVASTKTITAAGPIAHRAGPETSAGRFAIRTTPTRDVAPLSWFVVAHVVLSISMAMGF